MNTYRYTNRLINEKSPYLLQHAHNPVDWYPWSEEAFDRAKKEDRPVFLSIGYSTCHWCHVMERESFEDEEVAGVLNKYFVSIKVDREERPDIDSIYMSACQAVTGQGGWPLTIIMTPEKKPFFAGTYFPKKSKYGYPGLVDILNRVKDVWSEKKHELVETGNRITEAIRQDARPGYRAEVDDKTIAKTFEALKSMFDKKYGGFGTAPKFPTPHNLSFLLRYWKSTGDKDALNMVEKTLESIYKGGIFDHVGFGASRYSTDRKWLVPHFEKMLYDNALLAIACVEAYQVTGRDLYREVANKIFTYVMRDMTSPEGGFYSAEDADSEGEEGKFYLWDVEEIEDVAGKEDAQIFCRYYDITNEGNFEGRSIPNLINVSLEELKAGDLKEKLEEIRRKLFEYREKRVHPYKDDKILTAWNGLMIAAMAYAGRVMGSKEYIDCAEKAFNFIIGNLVREDGRLLARYREGEAAYPAYLDDYAFLVWGLIELYQATFKPDYLKHALDMSREMIGLFWDGKEGGLYLYGEDSEELIARPKEIYDGAIPSGNSVAALNMLRLAMMTGDRDLEEKSQLQMKVFSAEVERSPYSHSYFMMAALFSKTPIKEVVIAAQNMDEAKELLREVNERFLPFSTVLLNTGDEELTRMVPFLKGQNTIDCKPTAYVCRNFACSLPVNDIDDFARMLEDREQS